MLTMGHTYYQNIGHVVYHVRHLKFRKEYLPRLHALIRSIAAQEGLAHAVVGGTENHIHLLAHFPVKVSVSECVRRIKIKSCRWIRTGQKQYHGFSWQGGFGYFSVSPSLYARVAHYICTQEEHHRTMTAEEELQHLIDMSCAACGFPA